MHTLYCTWLPRRLPVFVVVVLALAQ